MNLNTLRESKPSVNELVLQFESEANDRLHSLTQACTNYVNPAESDAIWTDFIRWVNSHSWKLREFCFESAKKQLHEKLYGVLEPLLELFKPKLLTAPEVDMTLVVSKKEVQTKQDTQTEVTSPFE